MKITLLNVQGDKSTCIYKDWAGGFGTSFKVGNSLFSKMLEFAKRRSVNLPLMDYGYLAAIFNNKGFKVEYLTNKIPKDSDIVIIHSSTVDYKTELRYVKKIKNETKSKVGIIGPFSSVFPEFYKEYSDFIIKGEPEYIAKKISESYIPKGVVESKPINDLNSLPFPDWDSFPVKDYHYFSLEKRRILPMLGSRGCLYTCDYCPYLVQFRFRARSVDNIINEMLYLIKRYKIKGIMFRDPLFTWSVKHTEELAKRIISEKIDIVWGCETRLDHLNKPLLRLLSKSNLKTIEVGIESSNSEIIKKSKRKPIEHKHQKEIINYCKKIRINVSAFYIFGLPNDNRKSILETIKYAMSLDSNVASFNISTPYPGTEFYESVKSKIYSKKWEDFNSYTPVFNHKNLTKKDLLSLKEKAYIKYYFRPQYAIRFLKLFMTK
jgi:radical SAM superfamily enzyme YgiQ (UPF0313 family)